ncbi:hypothetical protein Lal_00022646, partial [Lupinus albus]
MDSKTLNQSPPFIRFYSLRFRSGDRLTTMEARNFDVVYAVASFVQLSVLKLVEAVEPLAAWALGNNLAPSVCNRKLSCVTRSSSTELETIAPLIFLPWCLMHAVEEEEDRAMCIGCYYEKVSKKDGHILLNIVLEHVMVVLL